MCSPPQDPCQGSPFLRRAWRPESHETYVQSLGTPLAQFHLDACRQAALSGSVCVAFAALQQAIHVAADVSGMHKRVAGSRVGQRQHSHFLIAHAWI